jgi:ABC-type transporter Mla maintaining outer membrane lipid asymmetry ATPase subunit MlaF
VSYCDVSLPVPLDHTFTYRLPETMRHRVETGCRVLVPFGTRKLAGVVLRTHDEPPSSGAREALRLLDEEPALDAELLKLGRWISAYYCAPLGETLRAMTPLSGDVRHTRIYSLTPSGRDAARQLHLSSNDGDDPTLQILRLLDARPLSASYLAQKVEKGSAILRSLEKKGFVASEDTAAERDPLRASAARLRAEFLSRGEGKLPKSERELLQFRRQVGFVFQEGALFDSLTVGENVAYRLQEDGMSEEEMGPRVDEVLRFVELEHTADLLPSELSGGMRRRVSIARALITRPPIVLYDSPTAGLDPITSQTIITLILRLRDVYGVTALLATHRLQDGFALANFHFDPQTRTVRRGTAAEKEQAITRFLVLRDGRIYFEGAPEEMLGVKDPYLQRFLI